MSLGLEAVQVMPFEYSVPNTCALLTFYISSFEGIAFGAAEYIGKDNQLFGITVAPGNGLTEKETLNFFRHIEVLMNMSDEKRIAMIICFAAIDCNVSRHYNVYRLSPDFIWGEWLFCGQ
jgi:hypothetical protein